mmetsp:Transcript_2486/g.6707  ORF Transcript_2486/g.6707 Transcript_2486/m.6707 type:complete len:315 (-) Transcript_2486:599-1543(-)
MRVRGELVPFRSVSRNRRHPAPRRPTVCREKTIPRCVVVVVVVVCCDGFSRDRSPRVRVRACAWAMSSEQRTGALWVRAGSARPHAHGGDDESGTRSRAFRFPAAAPGNVGRGKREREHRGVGSGLDRSNPSESEHPTDRHAVFVSFLSDVSSSSLFRRSLACLPRGRKRIERRRRVRDSLPIRFDSIRSAHRHAREREKTTHGRRLVGGCCCCSLFSPLVGGRSSGFYASSSSSGRSLAPRFLRRRSSAWKRQTTTLFRLASSSSSPSSSRRQVVVTLSSKRWSSSSRRRRAAVDAPPGGDRSRPRRTRPRGR